MGNFDGSEELSATLNGECTSQYDIIINNNYGSLEQFVEVSHIQPHLHIHI